MNHWANDELEVLLRTRDNRVARRRFQRLMAKYWPLTPAPDPVRHPRLCVFVQEYEKALTRATIAP
jgi:hypothetical protein